MFRTAEDIQGDLERMDYGDPEIRRSIEYTRLKCKQKGLPYVELMRSKTLGTIKYILKEMHDANGTVFITDMDTNNTFTLIDPPEPRPETDREKIRRWIAAGQTASLAA